MTIHKPTEQEPRPKPEPCTARMSRVCSVRNKTPNHRPRRRPPHRQRTFVCDERCDPACSPRAQQQARTMTFPRACEQERSQHPSQKSAAPSRSKVKVCVTHIPAARGVCTGGVGVRGEWWRKNAVKVACVVRSESGWLRPPPPSRAGTFYRGPHTAHLATFFPRRGGRHAPACLCRVHPSRPRPTEGPGPPRG